MTDPYVPKKAGDVIFADDWNAMQVQMIDHHRLHQHRGDDGTPRIPRAGIEPQAIDGSLIDPAASITVKNLAVSEKLDVAGPVTAKGALNVGGPLKANGTVEVAGRLSFRAAGEIISPARMHIGGDESLYVLNKSGMIIGKEWGGNGDLSVQGNAAVGGQFTVGGALKANGTLDVAGQLKANGSLDVAGPLKANGTLDVAGPLRANATLDVAGALKANGALDVAGPLKANGTLDVAGPLKANGTLAVKADFSVGGKLSIPASGQIYSPGRMQIHGEELLYVTNKNGIFLSKDAGGSGDLLMQGNLLTHGLTTAGGGLKATGMVDITGPFKANGTFEFTGPLFSNGPLTASTTLDVAGILAANGPLKATKTLDVAGVLTANGPLKANSVLEVFGPLAANGAFVATKTLEVAGVLTAGGPLVANKTLEVKGEASIAGGTKISGALNVGGDVAVGGGVLSIPASAKLYSSGRLHIDSRELLYVMCKTGVTIGKWGDSSGNLSVEGTLNVGGDVAIGGAKITATAGGQLYCPGTFHLAGEDMLYLLNKKGVIIGKEWGGNGNLTVQGDLKVNGSLTAPNFPNWSDARLKDNIQTVDNALDKVMALRGVSFCWKSDGKAASGLIAQEVEAIIPDAVEDNTDGMKTINYSSVIPFLIEAIKDQQAQIDQLRAALAQVNG